MTSIVHLTFNVENAIIGNPTDENVEFDEEITESHVSFDEFVGKLTEEVQENAPARFNQVPQLDESISAPFVELAWIEMMKAHIFDMVPTLRASVRRVDLEEDINGEIERIF